MQIKYRGYPQGLQWADRAAATPQLAAQEKLAQADVLQAAPQVTEQTRPITEAAPQITEPVLQAAPAADDLKPYMFYRGGDRPEEAVSGRQAMSREMDYFKSLYPLSVRRHQALVEECCDRMDYPQSPMYDEFPDRVMLHAACDGICRRAQAGGMDADRDLAQLLLVEEMFRRRMLRKA